MNTRLNPVMRRMPLRLLCATLGLWLISAMLPSVVQAGAGSALDQLKAAETALTQMEQNPPSVPADWSHAKDIDEAGRKFVAWQKAMLQERAEMERKQWKQFYQKLKVPPPLPPSEAPDPEPPMIRLDVPLPLPTDAQLSAGVGRPSASFSVGAEGKALSFVGASYKAGVAYSAGDNKWLVGDAVEFKAAFETGPVEVAGTYQYYSSTWEDSADAASENAASGSIGLSGEVANIKGAIGYNTQNEFSAAVGYDFIKTPKALSGIAEASVGVEAQVSAPVKIHGLTRGKRTLSSAISDNVARLVKYLTTPTDCPHCAASGQIDCTTCGNSRKVTCTKCNGALHFTCTRCEGGGELYCPNCQGSGHEKCSRCSGSGNLRCYTCGGSGSVTVYESEMQSRQVRRLISAGFDENGNPYEEWGWETEYYTVQVPRSQTCGSCGGTGSGGECDTCGGDGDVACHRCGGGGTVQCTRCGGDGQVDCGTCRGTGKITCPACKGKPIKCPLCKGKQRLGK